MSILKSNLWKGIKRETKKLEILLDYKRSGMITDAELERLADEQLRIEESLSDCCGAEVNRGGFCTACGEHDRA